MSTAAMSVPVNPLAGVAPALRGFRTSVQHGSSALRSLTGRIKNAATSVDRIRSSADQAAGAVRRTKADADAAARSVAHTGRTAATGARGVKSVGSRAKGAVRSFGKLAVGLGGVLALVAGLIDVAGIVGDLMGTFGTVMTIGSGVMLVINALTRANPIGFVTGLLLPVAGWLLDLAMNSETGQRLMGQLAKLVLKYVQGYLKIMTPLLKAIAKTVVTYVTVYLTVITTALRVIGALVGTGFAVLKALTTGDTRALRGKAASIWRGFRNAVKPVLNWITRDIPRMFSRVKGALSGTLGAMGRFVTTGAQTVAGVIKGPINGLIAFANWVIDGLNSLSFSLFGKRFGVHLSKIPMLAEGGVALPGIAGRGGRVRPLSDLAHHRLGPARTHRHRPHTIAEFREEHGAGPSSSAEDLLFLATAHAHVPEAERALTPA